MLLNAVAEQGVRERVKKEGESVGWMVLYAIIVQGAKKKVKRGCRRNSIKDLLN